MNNISTNATQLVIVAGHAIYLGKPGDDPALDANWVLLPFQAGEPLFYLEHMKAAVSLTAQTPEALLIFSGGQTRQAAGQISEAQSYWNASQEQQWWGESEVSQRCLLEEYARDSFENLLFSICRFREYTGRYPDEVTMVSWSFKKERFELHRTAIGFPAERFHYLGANNPVELTAAQQGEQKALSMFRNDPFGRNPETSVLLQKRIERDPFKRTIPYISSCAEVRELLECREMPNYDGLPW